MDKEIINILKSHGCLYMAEDYKELLTDIEKHYKQAQALQLLQPDVSDTLQCCYNYLLKEKESDEKKALIKRLLIHGVV